MPGGRPTTYTPELGAEIAAYYAIGYSWREIFDLFDGISTFMTLEEWAERHPEFASQLARARISHAEIKIDDNDRIARTTLDPQRARVIVDNNWRKASKLNKRYADKIDMTIEANVSIVAALDAAAARLLRSISDQSNILDAQAIDVTDDYAISAGDSGSSVAALEHVEALPDFFD